MFICDDDGLLCIELSVVEWLAAFLEPMTNAKIEMIMAMMNIIITTPIAPTTAPKTSADTVAGVSVYG